MDIEQLLTSRDVAQALGVPCVRARYLIDLAQVQPVAVRSGLRLYSKADLPRIMAERDRLDAKRQRAAARRVVRDGAQA